MKKGKSSVSDSVMIEKALREAAKHAEKLSIQTKTKFITRKVKTKKARLAS